MHLPNSALIASAPDAATFSLPHTISLYGQSLLLGIFLAIVSFFSAYLLTEAPKRKKELISLIQSSSNMIFLCVGLTGVMVLVNNNLARAFAIGAALTIVRFRVKLSSKKSAANLLFAIIIGIASGLGEDNIAWGGAIIYIIIETIRTCATLLARKKGYMPDEED